MLYIRMYNKDINVNCVASIYAYVCVLLKTNVYHET